MCIQSAVGISVALKKTLPLQWYAVQYEVKQLRGGSNFSRLECPLVDCVECIFVTRGGAHSLCSLGACAVNQEVPEYLHLKRFTGALVPFRLLVLSCYLWTSTFSLAVSLSLNTYGPILRTGKTQIARYVSWCLLSSSATHEEVPPP